MLRSLLLAQYSAESFTPESERCPERRGPGHNQASECNRVRQFKSHSRPLSRWAAKTASVLVALLIVCTLAACCFAVQAKVGALREARTTVARTKSRITVDGLLNEPDWLETPPVGEILQRDPHPGEK